MADERQGAGAGAPPAPKRAAEGAAEVWVVAHGMVDDQPRGAVVSRASLGLDAAQWQRLVDLGAVGRQAAEAGDAGAAEE